MTSPHKNIVWLASYPKSGNTWFRIFLTNLRNESAAPADINEIRTDGIFSSRIIFEKATGIDASDLTLAEMDTLRPDVFRYYSARVQDHLFIKAHDAYTRLPSGESLFPADVSHGAIYFLRDPLDVSVSFAFHSGKTPKNADKTLRKATILANNANGFKDQLPQRLLTWSEHVRSWTEQTDIPVLALRYEDMRNEPLATFKRAVAFIGWEYSDEAIQAALDKSSFKTLKAQEETKGFKERTLKQKRFFRSGTVNDWQNHLTPEQADRIRADHAEVRALWGYTT